MGSQTGGDCALFLLSGEPAPAVLMVTFKALQRQGFLNGYALAVRKGNVGNLAIKADPGLGHPASHAISGSYVHGGATPCNSFFGTMLGEDPTADVHDEVVAYIIPDTASNWLTEAEPFCTLRGAALGHCAPDGRAR